MGSLSEESLLAGFASKDAEISAAFVRRFQGRVFGLALTIVKDAAVAEDIAQETFVRAWQHAGAYDPRRGRVDTWLLTIARNLAIDARRVRSRAIVDADDSALLQLVGTEPDPEEKGVLADEKRRLREAILELTEEQRRVLLLASFQGCSGKEISRREGIPLGTVKTRLHAGMLRLRAMLQVGSDE
jgi:RNA polymerase sigma-70 factor (ECF subfamily)